MKLNWRDSGRRMDAMTVEVLKRWTADFDEPPKDGGIPAGIMLQQKGDGATPTHGQEDEGKEVIPSESKNQKPVHKAKPQNKPGNEVSAVRTTVRQFNIPNGYGKTSEKRFTSPPPNAHDKGHYFQRPNWQQNRDLRFEFHNKGKGGSNNQRFNNRDGPPKRKGACWTCGAPDHHSQFCPKALRATQAFEQDKNKEGVNRNRSETYKSKEVLTSASSSFGIHAVEFRL